MKIKLPKFQPEDHPSGYSPRLMLAVIGCILVYALIDTGTAFFGSHSLKTLTRDSNPIAGVAVYIMAGYTLIVTLEGIWHHIFKKQIITYAKAIGVLIIGYILLIATLR